MSEFGPARISVAGRLFYDGEARPGILALGRAAAGQPPGDKDEGQKAEAAR